PPHFQRAPAVNHDHYELMVFCLLVFRSALQRVRLHALSAAILDAVAYTPDERKSVVEGPSVQVWVDLGGRRISKAGG
ncbi:hypothetical protein AB2B41_23770, partial [Marimonas sp. MJW-29]